MPEPRAASSQPPLAAQGLRARAAATRASRRRVSVRRSTSARSRYWDAARGRLARRRRAATGSSSARRRATSARRRRSGAGGARVLRVCGDRGGARRPGAGRRGERGRAAAAVARHDARSRPTRPHGSGNLGRWAVDERGLPFFRLRRGPPHRPAREAARARPAAPAPGAAPARQRPHHRHGLERRLHAALEPGAPAAVGQRVRAGPQALRAAATAT